MPISSTTLNCGSGWCSLLCGVSSRWAWVEVCWILHLVKYQISNILKSNISKQLPSCRIVLSKPIIRHDDGKANLRIRNVNKHLSALQSEFIENDNISSEHLGQKGLHINPKGKGRLALNFMKQIRKFWRSVERLNESFLPFDLPDKTDHKVLRKSENLLFKPLNEENTYDIRELKHLRNENPYRVIIGHININSIRNKFESLVKYVGNNLDNLCYQKQKQLILFQSQYF